jgi:hypothetical protein
VAKDSRVQGVESKDKGKRTKEREKRIEKKVNSK